MSTLNLGPLELSLYSLMILIGVAFALVYGKYQLTKKGINSVKYDSLVLWTFIWGLVGARVWYVLANLSAYTDSSDPLGEMIAVWNGGLAIQGGIIVGGLAVVTYIKLFKPPFDLATTLEIGAPSVFLGQISGRWGNFFNQEVYGGAYTGSNFKGLITWLLVAWGLLILGGLIARRPWDKVKEANQYEVLYEKIIIGATIGLSIIFITQFFMLDIVGFIADGMYIGGEHRIPLFLVESLANLVGFLIAVFALEKFVKIKGVKLGFYFVWYGMVRMILEPLRDSRDIMTVNGVMVSVVLSVLFIVIGAAIIAYVVFVKDNIFNRKQEINK